MIDDEIAPDPSRWATHLRLGAMARIDAALDAFIDTEYEEAAGEAARAVELLGKAALWDVSPVLLAPLDRNHEAALHALATDARLDSPTLRTIALGEVLTRLVRVVGEIPLTAPHRGRLLACRNGSLHVGALPATGDTSAQSVARQVLANVVTVCDVLLARWPADPADGLIASDFYGRHRDLARVLADERRSHVERKVASRMAAARRDFAALEDHVDDEVALGELTDALEPVTHALIEQAYGDSSLESVAFPCPVCGHQGRIAGWLEVEGNAEPDYSDGSIVMVGFWEITLHPTTFGCNVCKLLLDGPQSLYAAGIPNAPFEVARPQDLGDEFDVDVYVENAIRYVGHDD